MNEPKITVSAGADGSLPVHMDGRPGGYVTPDLAAWIEARADLPPGFWMEGGEIRAFGVAAPNGGGWITGGGRVFAADAPGILPSVAYTVTRVTAPPTERVPLAECGGRIAKGHETPIHSLSWGGTGWVVCDKDGRTWPADPDGTVEVLTRGAEAQ